MTVTKRSVPLFITGSSSVHNLPSRLLNQDENQLLDKLIEPNLQSLASTVVQVFIPRPPEKTEWMKLHCGVMCILKDRQSSNDAGPRVLRVYCLIRRMILWEQVIDGQPSLRYTASCSYFHTLSVNGVQVGFNFADEEEAELILAAVVHRQLRGPLEITPQHLPKEGNPIKRMTKDDIGLPTDFKLISHVEWHPQRGFTLRNVDQNFFRMFTAQAGTIEKQSRCNQAEVPRGWDRASSMPSLARTKKKLSKADISPPFDFRLISYARWNREKKSFTLDYHQQQNR